MYDFMFSSWFVVCGVLLEFQKSRVQYIDNVATETVDFQYILVTEKKPPGGCHGMSPGFIVGSSIGPFYTWQTSSN